VLAVAVCGDKLATVSKLSKGKGSQVRVRCLAGTGAAATSASVRTSTSADEILCACWLAGTRGRLACGTSTGQVVLLDAAGAGGLEQLRRLAPSGCALSRIESLRFHPELGLLALSEYRHGPRVWGGELRVWVCDPRCQGGEAEESRAFQRVLAPKVNGEGGGGKAAELRDVCWHEDSLLLLHRSGAASLHVVRPVHLPAGASAGGSGGGGAGAGAREGGLWGGGSAGVGGLAWSVDCVLPKPALSANMGASTITSLARGGTVGGAAVEGAREGGREGAGSEDFGRAGCVAIAGDSALLHVHTPHLW